MWKITETIDGDHVGESLANVESGQVITFSDGDVVSITRIFLSEDGNEMVATGPNYSMTLQKD
jgi:hypothetical protein